MRGLGHMVLGLALAGSAGAQTMTEFGAAAAAGTVGGAAGKKVSDGISTIFGKLDQQTKAAAKEDPAKPDKPVTASTAASTPAPASIAPAASIPTSSTPAPVSRPASGRKVAKATAVVREAPPSVPDPPASAAHPAVVNKTPEPAPRPQPVVEAPPAPPPPPPPPEVTADNLKSITPGATREDVLKLGPPASRLTMFGDEGHLVEIYSYVTKGTTFGVVRLSDGSVSKVELR